MDGEAGCVAVGDDAAGPQETVLAASPDWVVVMDVLHQPESGRRIVFAWELGTHRVVLRRRETKMRRNGGHCVVMAVSLVLNPSGRPVMGQMRREKAGPVSGVPEARRLSTGQWALCR